MTTLHARPRRIDLDEVHEFVPDPEQPEVGHRDQHGNVTGTGLRVGETFYPAYLIVYDREDRPIARMPIDHPGGIVLLPGESLTIQTTLNVE